MPDLSFAPVVIWLATQLVPSPEIAVSRGAGGGDDALFGLRWQLTPVLWSFGAHRGISPVRAFLVEPMVRHSGSVELFASPEYLALHDTTGSPADQWFIRPGVRAYFPLAQHGEYLSCSLGTSYAWNVGPAGHSGAAWEAGMYTLFGVLGVQVTYSPTREPADVIATLSFRYF
jgi:hypothetical protein